MPKRKPWDLKTTYGRKKFYASNEWHCLRRIKLVETPFCEECTKEGLLVPTVDIHHLKDIGDTPELALSYHNLQGLCKAHHSRITCSTNTLNTQRFETVNLKWNLNEIS